MNQPFGPAMHTAVALLSGQFQRELGRLVDDEAKALGFPEGTQADLQKREWVLPDKPEAVEQPSPDKAEVAG